MTSKILLRILVAAFGAAAPLSAYCDDHHDHGHSSGHDGGHDGGHFSGHGHYYGGSYRGYYGGYGGYYGGYYSPYYYNRPYFWGPSFGLSFYSHPSYVYRGYVDDYRGDSLAAEVQNALRHRGYYHGPIDGQIGPGSRAGIRAFQANRGLPVTGRIDRPLIRALGID